MVFNFELVGLSVGLIWLIILSVLFWKISSHYNNLTKNASKKSLSAILDEVLKQIDLSKKDVDILKNRCDKIEKDGKIYLFEITIIDTS